NLTISMACSLMLNLVKIICTLFIFNVLALKKQQKSGDFCIMETGKPGRCIGIKDCPEALELLKEGIARKVCSYDNGYPVVCCGKTPGVKSLTYCNNTQTPIPKFERFPIIGGGIPSLAKEFPHMAALGFDNNGKIIWGCGGSLISTRFVLTASHCLFSPEFGHVKYVRLGDLNLTSNDDQALPQDFTVLRTHKHPMYKHPSKYHDIALLELDGEANMTDYVKPACLKVDNLSTSDDYIATGWGSTSFYGDTSDHLQKVNLQEIKNGECNEYYPMNDRILKKGIQETYQICAGNPGKDTCKGDSGGPLQTYNDEYRNAYDIVGITSFGKACLLTLSPGVYTRVAGYIEWIEEIVWPQLEI
ncbi:PREDICTED: serine protease snake-like, partial [Nicrophorus vespilloides]|uniref:CLIP domain-containing serine protease n=1 Tax=Nicrophorus vespilloides TaxID=110193 RepID=A0ABM1NIM3_NICVS